MPFAPYKPCRISHCAGYQVGNTGFCAAHQAHAKPFGTYERPKTTYLTATYNRRFRRLRDAFLRAHPLCVRCGTSLPHRSVCVGCRDSADSRCHP